MKTPITLCLVALAAPAFADMDHATVNHAMAATQTAAPTALSDGVIKKVDRAGARLTITHGPLQNLGMPGMTMAFRVHDAAMLDAVKPGDKIRFLAEDVGGILTVTRLQPAK